MNLINNKNSGQPIIIAPNSFIGKEIVVSADKSFSFKISLDKTIDYTNHQFNHMSGIQAYELINEPIASLFHSDMPRLILRLLEERLESGESMQIIQKYPAKDNRYFWMSSLYEPKIDRKGNVVSYTCVSKPISIYSAEQINILYSIISKIENKSGVKTAKRYLIGFFEDEKTNYNSYIDKLSAISINKKELLSQIQEEIISQKESLFSPDQYSISPRKVSKSSIDTPIKILRKGA